MHHKIFFLVFHVLAIFRPVLLVKTRKKSTKTWHSLFFFLNALYFTFITFDAAGSGRLVVVATATTLLDEVILFYELIGNNSTHSFSSLVTSKIKLRSVAGEKEDEENRRKNLQAINCNKREIRNENGGDFMVEEKRKEKYKNCI